MNKGMCAIAAVLGVGLGALATPASAIPLIGVDAGLKVEPAEASAVEKVRWVRRCWRDRWGRHCRRVWIGPDWGPGFGLYFGGPRRHHFRGDRFRGDRHFRGHRHFRGGDGRRGRR
jgi:hypothetical protein